MWRGLLLFLFLSAASGCTQFPELDATIPQSAKDAEYPALIPLEGLGAQVSQGQSRAAQTQTGLEARVAALRARAAQLRGPIIDRATRARMRDGVSGG